MLKYPFVLLVFLYSGILLAQSSDLQNFTIEGKVWDQQVNTLPIPYASIRLSPLGTEVFSDEEGVFSFENLSSGDYTLEVSSGGYQSKTVSSVVLSPQQKSVYKNVALSLQATALEAVNLSTPSKSKLVEKSKTSEVALLKKQQKSVTITEAVGVQQLKKQAVTDIAKATTKIAGVNKVDGLNALYIRGLGDRYIATTLNGLSVPSDDVTYKNLDLSIVPVSVVQNVAISKTFSSEFYGDQASGNIDIVTRVYDKKTPTFKLSGSLGVNSNILGGERFTNFKQTQNAENTIFGFYKPELSLRDALLGQSWNTTQASVPLNSSLGLSYNQRLLNGKLKLFVTANTRKNFDFREGEFRAFQGNELVDEVTDAIRYQTTWVNSLLSDATYRLAKSDYLRYVSLFLHKTQDQVYEFGRNGQAVFFEETNLADRAFQFRRDQNIRQTTFWTNQLFWNHGFQDKSALKLGLGYNMVNAGEPSRLRNEVNLFPDGSIYYGNTSGYQQRRSSQQIKDKELTSKLTYQSSKFDTENSDISFLVGTNGRYKQRDFESIVEGLNLSDNGANYSATSIDNLSQDFIQSNIDNDVFQISRTLRSTYNAELLTLGVFSNLNINYKEDLDIVLGLRYEHDQLNLPSWDVVNSQDGSSSLTYNGFLPNLLLKYNVGGDQTKQFLKFGASRTVTLPEFKELAPFIYESPNGREIRGNPDLMASDNYNADLKWEYFLSPKELLSVTSFGKYITDPINKVISRGSSGVFEYHNTSDYATVFGLELELRKALYEQEDSFSLSSILNVSRIWHQQNLKPEDLQQGQVEEFRYGNTTKIGLEGASDWVVNASLSYEQKKENPISATASLNYTSDKIFALGGSTANEDYQLPANYNNEIVEKGFVTLDATLQKEFSDRFTLRFIGRDLLSPLVKQEQRIDNAITNTFYDEVVYSYRRAARFSFNFQYSF